MPEMCGAKIPKVSSYAAGEYEKFLSPNLKNIK
jgi:hypothetical protein